MRRLLLLILVVVGLAAALPWLPGPPLVERLPRASVIYSRPLVLVPGALRSAADVRAHLERAQYGEAADGEIGGGEYRLARREWTIGLRPFRYPDGDEPGGVYVVRLAAGGRIETIRGPDGRPHEELFLEPVPLALPGGEARVERDLLRLDALPQHLIDAVLVAEDRRFFVHPGVDPLRVAGAALENAREQRIVEGGSTLTQQLVKNVYLTNERTWSRKFKEAAIAFWLELRFSKREILEAYLNEIYLGQDGSRAIHGVGPAARFWFGKDAADIDVAEAALLAGIVRAPSALAPDRHAERARARRDQVLDALVAHGRIEPAVYEAAKAKPVRARRHAASVAFAPRFAAHVAAGLTDEYGDDALTEAGLRAFTTLDPHFQRAARRAVSEEIARLEKGYPLLRRKASPLQAALVALDPHTGDVLAWVGGRTALRGSFDRVSSAKRQPGSVFKPVVALAALTLRERGRPDFTLATLLEDAPLELDVEGEIWAPANHDGEYRGAVSLRSALEDSLNVPMARLGMEVGLVHVAETARRLGIGSPLRPLPSLSLGAFEVTPLEIVSAYGVFAARGTHHAPRSLVTLEETGRSRAVPESPARAVFGPQPMHLVTDALRGAVDRGTGAGLRRLGIRGPVAGKTGTSNDFRDAWFVAFTPDLVVGAWVGFDDGKRVGLTGARAALPIVARFLGDAVGSEGWRDFEEPPGLDRVEIDPVTGLRAREHCPGREEIFASGTAPARACPRPRRGPERWFQDLFGRRSANRRR